MLLTVANQTTAEAEIVAKNPDGSAVVRFTTPEGEPITAVANRVGEVPLPPYIERRDASPTEHDQNRQHDLERYQTVYANRTRQVAVAAPTAGLHFTPELLATLATQGVDFAEMTLHVGLGTFKPMTTDTVEEHAIHREVYEVPVTTQRALRLPRTGRRIAIGTTSVRIIRRHPPASSRGPPRRRFSFIRRILFTASMP